MSELLDAFKFVDDWSIHVLLAVFFWGGVVCLVSKKLPFPPRQDSHHMVD